MTYRRIVRWREYQPIWTKEFYAPEVTLATVSRMVLYSDDQFGGPGREWMEQKFTSHPFFELWLLEDPAATLDVIRGMYKYAAQRTIVSQPEYFNAVPLATWLGWGTSLLLRAIALCEEHRDTYPHDFAEMRRLALQMQRIVSGAIESEGCLRRWFEEYRAFCQRERPRGWGNVRPKTVGWLWGGMEELQSFLFNRVSYFPRIAECLASDYANICWATNRVSSAYYEKYRYQAFCQLRRVIDGKVAWMLPRESRPFLVPVA